MSRPVEWIRPVVGRDRYSMLWWAQVLAALGLVLGLRPDLGYSTMADVESGFWLFLALVIFWDLRPIVTSGGYDPQGVNLSIAFVFAVLLRYGLGPALLIMVAGTLTGEIARRNPPHRAIFGMAQCTLAYLASWGVLHQYGFEPSLVDPAIHTAEDLPVVLSAAATYHMVTLALTGLMISARSGRSFVTEFMDDFAFYSGSTAAVLAVAPILVVVAQVDWLLVLLLLPPLLAVHRTAAMSVDQEHQSQHDALTGLANRKRLDRIVKQAIHGHQRPREAALLLLDLDRFKQVNDTLGHQAGDELLEQVAQRLEESVRGEDIVARLGGDEFAVWLAASGCDNAQEVAERLRSYLQAPFELSTMVVDVGASVGIARYPQDGETLDELLRCADVAMYAAKEGATGVEVYDSARDDNTVSRLGLVAELRQAINEGELELHYQPKVAFRDRAIVGVEALVRWQHPHRGLLPPSEFLELAQQAGMMRDVTDVVVGKALAQAAAWRDMGIAVPIAVNISPRDLADAQFGKALAIGMALHDLGPEYLRLEVTEHTLMDAMGVASRLATIEELGVSLSLDDFGTGYSSLSHLRRLPVSELKIAGTFVAEMRENDSIVRSIVQMAQNLGLQTVAEGVETAEDWQALRALGCDMAQGWLFAPALSSERATACLQRGTLRFGEDAVELPTRGLPATPGDAVATGVRG